ncbi:hypothetical protein BGW42_005831, partial [Actinomortierella wolfii]
LYLGVTLRWIDEDFNDYSTVLGVFYVPHPYNAASYNAAIRNLLREFGIFHGIVAATTDTA